MNSLTLPTTKANNNTFSSFGNSQQNQKKQQSKFGFGNNQDKFEKTNKKKVLDIEKLIKNDKTYLGLLGAIPGLALYFLGFAREWHSKVLTKINPRIMDAGVALYALRLLGIIMKNRKLKKENKNEFYPKTEKKRRLNLLMATAFTTGDLIICPRKDFKFTSTHIMSRLLLLCTFEFYLHQLYEKHKRK